MRITSHPPRVAVRLALLLLGTGIALVALALPGGAIPASTELTAAAGPPQLSIGVDDGRASTTTGDQLSYSITVTSLGSTDLTALHVTQSIPSGLTGPSSDSAATRTAAGLSWTVDVRAGSRTQLRSAASVSATPSAVLRLATVVCASESADSPPIVCATDSDLLPAGAAANSASKPVGSSASTPSPVIWALIGTGGAVVVVTGLLVVTRRRRRHLVARSSSGATTQPGKPIDEPRPARTGL